MSQKQIQVKKGRGESSYSLVSGSPTKSIAGKEDTLKMIKNSSTVK